MRVGLAPVLDGDMIIGRYCPLLYEVLDQVKKEEIECKGWPLSEGWTGEEIVTTSRDDGEHLMWKV